MKTDENDFDLTLDNAKEHYIKDIYGCPLPWERKFYLDNFTKEEFLSWNEELVYKLIDEYNKKDEIIYSKLDDMCDHICNLSLIIIIYVVDKNIYEKRIELIKELYSQYGYFMNYYTTGYDEGLARDLYAFRAHWYHHMNEWGRLPRYDDPSIVEFYDNSRVDEGLFPDLYYLKYYDLLDKYLEECFLPICLHYKEPSKYLNTDRLRYYDSSNKDDIDDSNIVDSKYIVNGVKYLRKINYKLPEKLDKFWKERGL